MKMTQTAWLVALACVVFSSPSTADWFHKKVSYDCRAKAGVLTIKYEGAYNEAGKLMLSRKGKDEWDPWDLLRRNSDKSLITGVRSVSKVCIIGKRKYAVTIAGVFENAQPSGKCGSHVTARLKIHSEGRELFDGAFESGCDYTYTHDVLTEVRLSSASSEVVVTRLNGDDFYRMSRQGAVSSP